MNTLLAIYFIGFIISFIRYVFTSPRYENYHNNADRVWHVLLWPLLFGAFILDKLNEKTK